MEPRRSPGFHGGALVAWRAAIPIVRGLARWWAELRVEGDRVADGPAVVAANHLSHVDPVFVSVIVGRPVRYLALDELYGNSWLFDTLTLWLGAIPVPRKGVPLGAMRTSLAELDAGGIIGVFPEGARVQHWGERPAKRGASWLARRAGVPLIPVAVAGTDGVMGLEDFRMRRSPVTATVCDPIMPADFADRADPVGAMIEEWVRRIDQALSMGEGGNVSPPEGGSTPTA